MSPTANNTTKPPTLTVQPTHEAIFQYIVAYKRHHDGLAPDVGSIGQACGVNISTVRYHLARLENDCLLTCDGRRQISVTGGQWLAPGDHPPTPHHDDLAVEQLQRDADHEVLFWKGKARNAQHLLAQVRQKLCDARDRLERLEQSDRAIIASLRAQLAAHAPTPGNGQHTKGLESALASKSAECERLRRQLYRAQQRAGGQRAMIAHQKRIEDLELENERLRASLATATTAWQEYQFRAQAFEQRPN